MIRRCEQRFGTPHAVIEQADAQLVLGAPSAKPATRA
jgi:hypothetical protein